MSDPIRPELRELMNDIGHRLGTAVKPHGFALLVFDFGGGGYMNWISNAKREDMLVALKEMIARLEGRSHDQPETPQ